MKGYCEMSEVAQEVADQIDEKLYEFQEACQRGVLAKGMCQYVAKTARSIINENEARLTADDRQALWDWFDEEYEIPLD